MAKGLVIMVMGLGLFIGFVLSGKLSRKDGVSRGLWLFLGALPGCLLLADVSMVVFAVAVVALLPVVFIRRRGSNR